jgi:ATP-binding cassette, subfamily A (ABC1), member 3
LLPSSEGFFLLKMLCGQFFRQFRVLAWKNALLKYRGWGTLLLEILVPTVIIIILGAVKLVIPTVTVPETFPTSYSTSSTLNNLYTTNAPLCRGQNLVLSCLQKVGCDNDLEGEYLLKCQPRKIAVAPSSPSNVAAKGAAASFIKFAQDSSAIAKSLSTFTYFESEASFIDFMGTRSYSIDPSVPIYSSAIIFNEGYPNWDYTVRLNMTYSINGVIDFSPSTAFPINDIAAKSPDSSSYLSGYLNLGIYTIFDNVNSFIASSTLCTTTKNTNENCPFIDPVSINTLGTAEFPNVATLTQGFWSVVGYLFALLIIISLLLPLANVIKSLVQEKETKLREGMMMMSLRSDVLWLTWIMHFMLLFLPLSIILTLAGQMLFTYSSPAYIFIYFLVFFISATSYAILVSNFFSNSRTAAIVGCLVFFMGFFIYIGLMNSKPSRSSILAACLHPAAAFTYGTDAFIE